MRVAAPRNQAVLKDDVMEVHEDPELEEIEISSGSDDGEVLKDPGLEVISISSGSDEDVPQVAVLAWPAWAGLEPSIGEYWFNEWMHYRVTFGETYYNKWLASLGESLYNEWRESFVVMAGDFETYDWMAYYNNK
jgi:hypothetical protein